MDTTDEETVIDALEYFVNDEEDDIDDSHPLFPTFMSWMLFKYVDDVNDNRIIAKDFLKQKKKVLNAQEQEYLLSGLKSNLSFFEVLDVKPGESISIVDLLDNSEWTVYEASATQSLNPRDLILAKIVTINKTNFFDAVAPVAIPSGYKVNILHFKHWLQDQIGTIENDQIPYDSQMDILDYFQEIYSQLMNPARPVLTNTDGHLLVPHKMFFEVESAEIAFDKLHTLCHTETKKQKLEMAKFSGSKLRTVDFPWLSKSTKKRPQPIVLGNLQIEGKELIVEVNSRERADLFKKTIKKAMPEGSYKFKRSIIDNIDKQLESLPKTSPTKSQAHTPEMEKILEQHFQKHWEKWPTDKLPALNNKRPIDVIKTQQGRELVEALISEFENSYSKNPLPGMRPEFEKELRKKLGL